MSGNVATLKYLPDNLERSLQILGRHPRTKALSDALENINNNNGKVLKEEGWLDVKEGWENLGLKVIFDRNLEILMVQTFDAIARSKNQKAIDYAKKLLNQTTDGTLKGKTKGQKLHFDEALVAGDGNAIYNIAKPSVYFKNIFMDVIGIDNQLCNKLIDRLKKITPPRLSESVKAATAIGAAFKYMTGRDLLNAAPLSDYSKNPLPAINPSGRVFQPEESYSDKKIRKNFVSFLTKNENSADQTFAKIVEAFKNVAGEYNRTSDQPISKPSDLEVGWGFEGLEREFLSPMEGYLADPKNVNEDWKFLEIAKVLAYQIYGYREGSYLFKSDEKHWNEKYKDRVEELLKNLKAEPNAKAYSDCLDNLCVAIKTNHSNYQALWNMAQAVYKKIYYMDPKLTIDLNAVKQCDKPRAFFYQLEAAVVSPENAALKEEHTRILNEEVFVDPFKKEDVLLPSEFKHYTGFEGIKNNTNPFV